MTVCRARDSVRKHSVVRFCNSLMELTTVSLSLRSFSTVYKRRYSNDNETAVNFNNEVQNPNTAVILSLLLTYFHITETTCVQLRAHNRRLSVIHVM